MTVMPNEPVTAPMAVSKKTERGSDHHSRRRIYDRRGCYVNRLGIHMHWRCSRRADRRSIHGLCIDRRCIHRCGGNIRWRR